MTTSTATTTITLYADPQQAGLAYSADEGDIVSSGPAGPGRGDVEGYGQYGDTTHHDDVNAAIEAIRPWMVGEPDTSEAGTNGLLCTVTVTDYAAAARALEGLR